MGHFIQTIDDRTWLIEEEGSCNVYMFLLAGTERALLLDTGLGTLDLPKLLGELTDLPVTVLCTHGHFDHIGGNGWFDRVWMHEADREVYREHKTGFAALTPGAIAPAGQEELCWFRGSRCIDLGGRELEIFETPGHTQGSVAVLDRAARRIFTGDTCCKAAVLLNFPHSASVETFRESIRKILSLRDSYDVVWPSHHARPIDASVPEQFLQAADLVLGGAAAQTVHNDFGDARMFPYGDVCILY